MVQYKRQKQPQTEWREGEREAIRQIYLSKSDNCCGSHHADVAKSVSAFA